MFETIKKLFRKQRSFEAAKITKVTASWARVSRSINEELKGDLDGLRARSEGLAKNDTSAKRFLSLCAANVIGSNAVTFQSKVLTAKGDPDTEAIKAIEAAFKDWGKCGNYDITGKLSRAMGERMAVKCAAKTGEILIREHTGFGKYGYQLEFLDVNRLDTQFNRKPSENVNEIIMGVEVDAANRPVNYFLKKNGAEGNRVAIPADEIIHMFIPEDPEQIRGFPWMHAAMIKMFHLKKYQEWAIIASAVGASKMGFFTTPDGDGTQQADGEDSDTGELFQEASAGQFGVMPEGTDFKSFDPDYPHQMYAEFVKTAKRDISSGVDVSYHSLANDLEGVNFSSIRAGTLEDREQWKVLQGWFIDCGLVRIFNNWLSNALLQQAIKMSNGKPLPAAKREQFSRHEFQGRRWQWVDPLKDTQANKLAVESLMGSPSAILAQQGMDAEEVLEDIKKFKELAESKNLTFNNGLEVVNVPQEQPEKDEGKEDDD